MKHVSESHGHIEALTSYFNKIQLLITTIKHESTRFFTFAVLVAIDGLYGKSNFKIKQKGLFTILMGKPIFLEVYPVTKHNSLM